MALQVIGAGFGRTGTSSLKLALERLGFSRCHHMREVVASRAQIDAWLAASRGEPVDWDVVFEGFRASCDWPSSAYWEQLHHHYPDAKVILTAREEKAWYRSVRETIHPISHRLPGWFLLFPRVARLREMIFRTVWDGTFGGRFSDEEHAIAVYRAHVERVKRGVAPDRLLVFEAKDGWEPLCAFLGVPVPEGPYPHVNEAKMMKRLLVVFAVLRWLPLALLLGIVALLI